MGVHVAIVTPPYDRLILGGRKKVECRLTKTPLPPFGCIAPGERVYFKRSAGPFFAVAVVDRVWTTDNLSAARVDSLRKRFNDEIHGEASYWKARRTARYGTLVWLREVTPTSLHPTYRTQNMRAWYTLDDAADPLGAGAIEQAGGANGQAFTIELMRGSITQSQVRVTRVMARFPADCYGGRTKREAGEPITLRLRGGPAVTTDIVSEKKLLRWRGWRGWFERQGLGEGDAVRLTPRGRRVFDVAPVKRGR